MTTFEWNPPAYPDAEDAVLGSLLHDNERLADVREVGLAAAHFTRASHGGLYELIEELVDQGGPANIVTLPLRLRGHEVERAAGVTGVVFLKELMETVHDARRAVDYARIVRGAAEACRIGAALVQAVTTLNAYPGPGGAALESVERQLADLQRAGAGHGLRGASEIMGQVFADVDAAQQPEAQEGRLLTGWSDLDRVVGPLQPGSMIVVAARPSQGKSSLATSLMERIAIEQARGTALVTLEVSAEDALRNLACCMARVDGQALMGGRLADDEYRRFLEAHARVAAAPIHVLDQSSVTSARVRGMARRVARTYGVEVLIVDYLQLLTPVERRNQNREREVARMSADLKAAAREAGIVVVVLSQLNRAVENRQGGRPNLSDLRDSGSIEQDADVVILLSTEETRESEDHGPVDRKILDVAKNRNGPTGAVRLAFHRQWTRFADVAGFELLPEPPGSTGGGPLVRRYSQAGAGR